MSKFSDAEQLIAEVAKQKKLQCLKNRDIAEATGFTLSTVNSFTAGFKHSNNMANAVCKFLGIER